MRHATRPAEPLRLPAYVLREFASLSDEDFARLMEAIRRADDIRLAADEVDALKKQFGDAGKSVQVIIVFAGNVLSHLCQSDDFEAEKQEFIEVLKSFLSDEIESEEESRIIFERIENLLQPWGGAETRRKREWLENGILRSATEFASFVDLRPSFTAERDAVNFMGPIYVCDPSPLTGYHQPPYMVCSGATGANRGGPGYLNRFSASISGASAGVRLPCGLAAG